ncbi:hypothetical protein HZU40_11345 [Mycolicibacterium fluoranthenivorans]|uniref:Uncharacterized protein n=1 Tax=Mycolicibacterium fluoranthenivorans TaxID=258505 RepID=A0A7G8PKB7_9MYCO|nr:hypothetical protein [Mycolicibacterium fluoranthenivorans]QNJ94783.1 hypothetical protein HZU40_11345 [Mycolicibacterium fluoranthenivorans]
MFDALEGMLYSLLAAALMVPTAMAVLAARPANRRVSRADVQADRSRVSAMTTTAPAFRRRRTYWCPNSVHPLEGVDNMSTREAALPTLRLSTQPTRAGQN